jgi:Zn-dependent protease/CBS domain-containing protein
MQGSFKIGTLAGIDIRVHYTWLFALFLIAWSLALGYFPMSDQGLGAATYWVLGIAAALLLFASVLVHELGHSVVAGARGLRVENITLFIFGGVSSIASEASTARDEFLIAVVGPLMSLLLAGLFWVVGQAVPSASAVGALANYLAQANLLLGLFNIVPGFPLDGGRVLRSIVWAVTGDMPRATRIASYVGQGVAFVLIGWGVVNVLSGNLFGGLWIAFIGWFLNNGAEGSRQQLTVRSALDGVPVTSVMDPTPEAIPLTLSVRDFVLEHALRRGQRALPVVEDGRLAGIVSITDAKHLGQEAWATTPVSAVMTRMPLKTLAPEADLTAALELMVANGIHQIPIETNGVLVGMLSRSDVMRHLQLGGELQLRRSASAPESAPPRAAASHS